MKSVNFKNRMKPGSYLLAITMERNTSDVLSLERRKKKI
jgi:hypothetical protein